MSKPKLKPVPRVALPIIKIIRAESARPVDHPYPEGVSTLLRFPGGCCPMGLCWDAESKIPARKKDFPYRVSRLAIIAFASWWDSIPAKLAKEAVDRVWGKK